MGSIPEWRPAGQSTGHLVLRATGDPIPAEHHNCFFYYRGPSNRSPDAELARYHQQVEDNTTKALVNTLEHSGPEVAHSFLRGFLPSELSIRGGGKLEFALQKVPDGALSEPRALLGISILGEADPRTFESAPEQDGSRVDAAIRIPGQITLLVEVKTEDQLDGAQLNRHARRWRLPEADLVEGNWRQPADWVLVTWAEIWRWARRERERSNLPPIAVFLLDQFTEYLDLQGFAPWAGFSQSDFEFFDHRAPERQVALRNKMSGLWERVFKELPDGERARLGTVHAGRLGRTRDPAWAQTNRGENGANLTVELSARELQLNLVGWDAHQSAAVARWLASVRPDELPSSVELVAWERRAKRANSGKPFWMGAAGTELRRFSTSEVLSGSFENWRRSWEAIEKTDFTALAYHLRRTWSRAEVASLGDQLPRELVDDVRSLMAPLAAINGWN